MRLTCLALLFGLASTAASAWVEPPRGSDTRGDLLGAIRALAAYDLSPPVEFVVSDLRQEGNIAFGILQPQRPGGAAIPWRDTRFAARGDTRDMFDGMTIHVFFQRFGEHWYVKDYSIGATDVWFAVPQICQTFQPVIPEFCQ